MELKLKCPCCNEDLIINMDKYCNITSVEKSDINNIEISEEKLKDIFKTHNIELG